MGCRSGSDLEARTIDQAKDFNVVHSLPIRPYLAWVICRASKDLVSFGPLVRRERLWIVPPDPMASRSLLAELHSRLSVPVVTVPGAIKVNNPQLQCIRKRLIPQDQMT